MHLPRLLGQPVQKATSENGCDATDGKEPKNTIIFLATTVELFARAVVYTEYDRMMTFSAAADFGLTLPENAERAVNKKNFLGVHPGNQDETRQELCYGYHPSCLGCLSNHL